MSGLQPASATPATACRCAETDCPSGMSILATRISTVSMEVAAATGCCGRRLIAATSGEQRSGATGGDSDH